VWADPGYVNDVGDGPVLLDPKMPLKYYGLKSNFVLQVVENGGDPIRPLPSLGSIEPSPESEISSQPSDDDEEDYSSVEEKEEKPQPRRNPVRACRKKQRVASRSPRTTWPTTRSPRTAFCVVVSTSGTGAILTLWRTRAVAATIATGTRSCRHNSRLLE